MRGRLLALLARRRGLASGISLYPSFFPYGLAPDRPPPDIIPWKSWLMIFIQTTNENEIRPAERRESGREAITLYVFSPPPSFLLSLSSSTLYSPPLIAHRAL